MTTKLPPGSGKNIKFTREELAKLRLQRRINHKAKLNNVFIIGGTHGNETNGVYLAKYFMKSPDVTCRSNFQTSVVYPNTRTPSLVSDSKRSNHNHNYHDCN